MYDINRQMDEPKRDRLCNFNLSLLINNPFFLEF